MTVLIKADNVRYLSNAHFAGHSRTDSTLDATEENICTPGTPDPREAELLSLKAQLAQLISMQAEAEYVATSEAAAAYEKGLKEGQALAVQDHESRDSALRAGVEQAIGIFRASLDALEPLAIDIALAALERIFGEAEQHVPLIAKTAAHHVTQLSAGSVIALEFAAADFPSNDELTRIMAAVVADHSVQTKVNAQLKAGQCLIRLDLGTLDASLDSQLERIRTALYGAVS